MKGRLKIAARYGIEIAFILTSLVGLGALIDLGLSDLGWWLKFPVIVLGLLHFSTLILFSWIDLLDLERDRKRGRL